MAAKIYEFPTQINGMYTEAYVDWQYKTFYDQEEDYYLEDYYQDKQEQGRQKNKACFAHKLFRKIVSIFQ